MKYVFSQEQLDLFKERSRDAVIFIVVCFALVILRLFVLQVWRGSEYRNFSSSNTIREVRLDAPRGRILDRRGRILASNRTRFDLVFIPQYVGQRERLLEDLPRWFDVGPDTVAAVLRASAKTPPFQPVVFHADADWDRAAWLLAHRARLVAEPTAPYRGIEVSARPNREYPLGAAAAHLIGYVGELETTPAGLKTGEWVGRYGLERVWDRLLRGMSGFQAKLVDAAGREVQAGGEWFVLEDRRPEEGWTLQTTIDGELQALGMNLLAGKAGAIVVMEIETGGILALVSSPSFEPARMIGPDRAAYFKKMLQAPGKPFFNRATQGAYPPGSTYKIVTALAGLTSGVLDPEETVFCRGFLQFGNRRFGCWRRGGHGVVDLARGLVESCDVYFYTMGLRLGVDRIAAMARIFGLDESTGIEVEEGRGLIPSSSWKEATLKESWQEGETLSVAVGQGYNLETPLAMARMLAGIISGTLPTPHLTQWLRDREGGYWDKEGGWPPHPIALDQGLRRRIEGILVDVVESPAGTAHGSRSEKISFGGKTGTAQNPQGEDHAWFVGFAPAHDPKIVAAVVVEHGGHGSSASAPIARRLFEKWAETL